MLELLELLVSLGYFIIGLYDLTVGLFTAENLMAATLVATIAHTSCALATVSVIVLKALSTLTHLIPSTTL